MTTATAEALKVNISRVFKAPREKVFAAWTDASKMQQWKGPQGWTVLECESDPRRGGRYRVVMRGMAPVGDNGEMVERTGGSHGEYLEFDPPSLLRFTWNADWAPGEKSIVTVRLSEVPEGTRMDFTHENFDTPESAAGHNKGWNSSLDKLQKFVEG